MRRFLLPTLLMGALCVALAVFVGPHVGDATHSFRLGPEHLPLLIGVVSPTTLTELNDLAKDYFSNVYMQLVNYDTPLKGQFAKLENADFTGRKWIFGVKTSVGGGSGNAGANKSLPNAAEGTYDQGEANVVRTYTRMAGDGLLFEVTKKKAGSYRPALAELMSDRLQAHDLEVNRQMFCNGDGVLAKVLTDSGVNQVLQLDYGVANGGTGSRHLYDGDQVQFYDTPGGTARTKRTVTAVDHSTATITLDGDPVTTTGDIVTRATPDTDNTIAGEAKGLLAATDNTSALHTIPAAGPWKAVVLANGGTLRPISDPLVMQIIETIRARSKRTPNLAVCRPGVVLKYSELFLPLRRLDGQDVQLKGGYKPLAAIVHAGGAIPVIGENDCPDSRVFFLDTGGIRMADLVGSEWADMDGATFQRITDKDAIEGYIRKYWALIWVQRNSQGLLEDIEDIGSIDRIAA